MNFCCDICSYGEQIRHCYCAIGLGAGLFESEGEIAGFPYQQRRTSCVGCIGVSKPGLARDTSMHERGDAEAINT